MSVTCFSFVYPIILSLWDFPTFIQSYDNEFGKTQQYLPDSA
jgi:hypothetical protein